MTRVRLVYELLLRKLSTDFRKSDTIKSKKLVNNKSVSVFKSQKCYSIGFALLSDTS